MEIAVYGDQVRQALTPDTIQCRVGQHHALSSGWGATLFNIFSLRSGGPVVAEDGAVEELIGQMDEYRQWSATGQGVE